MRGVLVVAMKTGQRGADHSSLFSLLAGLAVTPTWRRTSVSHWTQLSLIATNISALHSTLFLQTRLYKTCVRFFFNTTLQLYAPNHIF